MGDTISPNDGDSKTEYTLRLHALLDFLKEQNIPWVSTGGKHHPKVTREEMVKIDSDYGKNLSWTGYRWDSTNSTES
jgi:hypothetical protein